MLEILRQRPPTPLEYLLLLASLFFTYWYAWIMDDAYIYFRYADNLVIYGEGLVFNPGEYVEGFSSPFWMLLLAGLRLLHINFYHAVVGIGLASCCTVWLLALVINRELAPAERSSPVLNLPLAFLLMNYGVLSYFTSGLEAPLVIVMGAVYAAIVLRPGSLALQILAGVAPMIRHELAIPAGILLCWLWWRNGRLPWAFVLSGAVTLGGYVMFRIWYYADIFPLTFYLKHDQMWQQGVLYLKDTFLTYYAPLYFLVAAGLFVALRRAGEAGLRGAERLFMVLLALPVLVYVTRIGGDPRHFRYLIFPFVLLVMASGGLLEMWVFRQQRDITRYALAAVLALAVAVTLIYPRQISVHPLWVNKAGGSHEQIDAINDAALHRTVGWVEPYWNPDMDEDRWKWYFGSPGALDHISAVNRYENSETFGDPFAEIWCKSAYIFAPAYVSHSLGLTEPYLARTRIEADRPAHKHGLRPFANEMLMIRERYGYGPGAVEAAVADGYGADWLAGNEAVIQAIEARVFNRHDFFANLRTVLQPAGQIIPGLQEE